MKYPWIIVCLFCILLNNEALISQSVDTRMYTTRDGLSDNSIFAFSQDQFGYFWIGTGIGLNRFDGSKFKEYGSQHGMPSLICNTIFEDRWGRIWVGTRRGMAEFRKDSFYIYENTDHVQITYVFQLYENPKGELIANTLQGQYIFKGIQWEPYSYVAKPNKDIVVKTIKTNEGEYFKTTDNIIYKSKSGIVKSVWSHNPDLKILQSFGGEVYVSTITTVYKIDSVQREPIFSNELKNKIILNYFRDSRGRWWFSTQQDGLLILEEKNGFVNVEKVAFPIDYSANFYEDRENQIWITTPTGIMKVLPSVFSNLIIQEVQETDHIMNLWPYGDHELLLSFNNGQLLHIRYDIKPPATYKILASYQLDHKNDFIDEHVLGHNGDLWLRTRQVQLYLLRDGLLENKTNLVKASGQQFPMSVSYDAASGKILVANDSLMTIGNEWKLDTLFDSGHAIMPNPEKVMIAENDQLIIKSQDGDVFLYSLNTKNENYFYKLPISTSVERTLKLDHEKKLWIYDKGKNISRYTHGHSPGLALEEVIDTYSDNINTSFYHFNFDQNGTIWCVNNKGIQYIYKKNGKKWQSGEFAIYEIRDAAYTDWFKVVESEQLMWVNLKNQLLYFDRKIPERTAKSANVILEEVQLHNQVTSWDNFSDSLYSYFEIPRDLQLKYHENTLTFFYNCPTTVEDLGSAYSYRLLPQDTIWSKPSESKSISFSQLRPAQYTLQIRSRNTGMEWGDPTSFSFLIRKPFWDTIWFRIFLLLLVSGFVAWVFRIRLRQERVKGEVKSQLLELEMRALRAQMNPHFIYNALNSIQSLVATNQTASANKYISKFARLLRQVLENSKQSEIHLSRELDSLRLYVDLEKLRLDEEVKFIEHIEETIAPAAILIPPLVLQPFIENALWHGLSSKKGEKIIKLTITDDQDWIHFSIVDNGIGRIMAASLKSSSTYHESTAMLVTEQRLRDFNGDINSIPLEIEDLFSSDGSSEGTRVLLHVRKKLSSPTSTQ